MEKVRNYSKNIKKILNNFFWKGFFEFMRENVLYVFQGKIVDSKPQDEGKIFNQENQLIFEGEFRDGLEFKGK